MPLDEFIHDVRDKGTWVSRFSAESIQVLARGSRPVALNNAQETIVEQSMSYRAGTERDSGDDYRVAKSRPRSIRFHSLITDRSQCSAVKAVVINNTIGVGGCGQSRHQCLLHFS